MTTLLLVHAFPLDASMWDPQRESLDAEATILAPSVPGFGGTPAGGDILTMDAIADFLAGELDRAGVERAVVCGLSMGGYATFALWRRHRARIAGLVLADTRATPDDDDGKERRRGLAERVRAEGPGAAAEALLPALLSETAEMTLREQVRQIILRQPAEAIAAASLGMAERSDSRPLLAEIDAPTAIIVGADDALTPPPASKEMADAIPGAELTIIESAGHLSNLEQPGPFTAAVGALLERV
ncbi:MAG: alpha/beta fold hydrolase [Actinomycetota bacterium]